MFLLAGFWRCPEEMKEGFVFSLSIQAKVQPGGQLTPIPPRIPETELSVCFLLFSAFSTTSGEKAPRLHWACAGVCEVFPHCAD